MKGPTYEQDADQIETIIVALGASDAGLRSGDHAHFIGYAPSMQIVGDEMRRYGLTGRDFSAKDLTPKSVNMVGGGDRPGTVGLISVQRVGLFEAKRLFCLTGRGDFTEPVCRAVSRDIDGSGRVYGRRPVYYRLYRNSWVPLDDRDLMATGKWSRATNWQSGEFKEYAIIEERHPPYAQLAVVTEWGRRVCWSVQTSLPGSPSVSLVTDPIGVQALLRMRDVPEGMTRRQALRHWVREHWRQNRKDESIEHRVREHLRGADECDWFGLRCRIVPSELDTAKERLAATGGRKWRAASRREGAGGD